MKVVGLMSGTSLDGIDAVVVEVDARADGPAGGTPVDEVVADAEPIDWRVLAFETVPYPADRRRALHDAIRAGTPGRLARLHGELGEWFADAALRVCRAAAVDPADIAVIGSHGQTVWHQPPPGHRPGAASLTGDRPGARGYTLQLGDPATIAERTGCPVVSDFRSRDMAAGGQGAPLVPWVDRLLFAAGRPRTLLNIGGMANVTRVPARGAPDPIVAFDTGPGNAIIDAAMELATDGALRYDANGEWARRGRIDDELLDRLLADPYFRRPPPRSTGRERFGRAYVEDVAGDRRPRDRNAWAGLVATLTALVASSIADGITRWADPGPGGEVVVTGGGAENPVLMDRLAGALGPIPVRHGAVLGIDPAAKEAIAFGVLAWAHVTSRPANVPSATGAAGPRVLGSLTPGTPAGGSWLGAGGTAVGRSGLPVGGTAVGGPELAEER
ncbi:MAG: anhydro-N-acetylmuramic acid kinase [Gemmatimonadota bacterium]